MNSSSKLNVNTTKKFFAALLLSFSLGACSSGSNNDSIPETDSLSGKISGITIEGLSYKTESQSGKTNSESGFSYKAGETVSFFVGDIAVGEAVAAPELSLFNISGASDPETVAFSLEKKMSSLTGLHYLHGDAGKSSKYPFEGLSNLIVFLAAVDKDGIFTNGVSVPAQLTDVATGKSLNIKGTSLRYFAEHLNDSKLLDEGTSAGIWAEKPVLSDPMDALDAFYTLTEETPQTYILSKTLWDSNNDEIIDGTTKNTFDGSGNQIGVYRYSGDDEALTYQQEWAFNSQGQQILNREDRNGDGFFENWSTNEIEYHPTGEIYSNKYTVEADVDGNGVREVQQLSTNEYDTEGRLTLQKYWYQYQEGSDISNYTYIYTRDLDGRAAKSEKDEGSDGSIDEVYSSVYDANGRQIRSERDFNADGIADEIIIYEYDESGNQIFYSSDNHADGVEDQADGIVDYVSTRTYDSYGNQSSLKEDYGNDGVYEYESTWERTYDSEGRELSRKHVSTRNPEYNSFITMEYDSEGRQIAFSVDDDLDGITDRSGTTVFHDSYGGQTSTNYDASGTVTWVQSNFYDESGNYIEWYYDTDGDGVANQGRKNTYNSDNLKITESLIGNGVESLYETYKYDEQGKLISKYYSGIGEHGGVPSTAYYEYHNIKSWKAFFQRLQSRWFA